MTTDRHLYRSAAAAAAVPSLHLLGLIALAASGVVAAAAAAADGAGPAAGRPAMTGPIRGGRGGGGRYRKAQLDDIIVNNEYAGAAAGAAAEEEAATSSAFSLFRSLKEERWQTPEPSPEPTATSEAAEAAAAEEEEVCGTQWDRSIACGGRPDKRDVVPTCCPGYRCEGEWCVVRKTPRPTNEPTSNPTSTPTISPTESRPTTPSPSGGPTTMSPSGTPTKSPVAPTPAPSTTPPTIAPTFAPTRTPTPIPTLAPITRSPTYKPTFKPTSPPQPLLPSTGLISLPLGPPTVLTLTFPRAQYDQVSRLDDELVSEIMESFVYGRLLGELSGRNGRLVEGVEITGISLNVEDVEFVNLDQVVEELSANQLGGGGGGRKLRDTRELHHHERERERERVLEVDLLRDDVEDEGDNKGRRTQLEPAYSVGRPKAILTLSGSAKFRIDSDLMESYDNDDEDNNDGREDVDMEDIFILRDQSVMPTTELLHSAQRDIWSDNDANDDLLELLKVAGESARDVLGTVNFVKIEQMKLVPPTGSPTVSPVVGVADIITVEDDSMDGGGSENGGGDGLILIEEDGVKDTTAELDGTTGFIPVGPTETASATGGGDGGDSNGGGGTSTVGTVVAVMVSLVVLLGLMAMYLVRRKRRLDASAELVDKARTGKVRREGDVAPSSRSNRRKRTDSDHEDDADDSLAPSTLPSENAAAAATAAAGTAAAGTAAATSTKSGGGSGGWLSSMFKPKYLSPGKANKNRPVTLQRAGGDDSSIGSSSLGNGSVKSKGSWFSRVRSGVSDADGGDDFSVGAESIGGKAAAPAFTGDDSALGPMDPERGDMDMDDSVDITGAYDLGRTETGQSAWSFAQIGLSGSGGNKKPKDPPASRGPAVTPPRKSAGLEVTTDGPQGQDDDMEFSPDTRILNDEEDDFDREFSRNHSDLSNIQRGPGAIQPSSGYRYSAKSNLPTHDESFDTQGSPAPPPPASSPPPKGSPKFSRFAASIVKRASSPVQSADPTPPKTNKTLSYRGLGSSAGRKSSPPKPEKARSQGIKTVSSGERRGLFRPSYDKRDSFDRGIGGSGINSSTAPTSSALVVPSTSNGATPDDVQRKRMEARRKMQMQMEYDATPSRGPGPRNGSGGGSATYRPPIKQTYATEHSGRTERGYGGRTGIIDDASVNSAGSAVLDDLNKLSDFLKERKQQKALKEQQSNGVKKPSVAAYMNERGY